MKIYTTSDSISQLSAVVYISSCPSITEISEVPFIFKFYTLCFVQKCLVFTLFLISTKTNNCMVSVWFIDLQQTHIGFGLRAVACYQRIYPLHLT